MDRDTQSRGWLQKHRDIFIFGFIVVCIAAVTSPLPKGVMPVAIVVTVLLVFVRNKLKRRFLWLITSVSSETNLPLAGHSSLSTSQHNLCLNKVCDDRLAKYEREMRTGISLHGLVPLLEVPAGGFMTQEERIVVTSKESDPERVSKIISILRKKTDQDYFKFCDILENSGNEHWAAVLRQGVKNEGFTLKVTQDTSKREKGSSCVKKLQQVENSPTKASVKGPVSKHTSSPKGKTARVSRRSVSERITQREKRTSRGSNSHERDDHATMARSGYTSPL